VRRRRRRRAGPCSGSRVCVGQRVAGPCAVIVVVRVHPSLRGAPCRSLNSPFLAITPRAQFAFSTQGRASCSGLWP